MFRSAAFRQATRHVLTARPCAPQVARTSILTSRAVAQRPLTSSLARRESPEEEAEAATTAARPGESGEHEGRFARTDEGVRIEHPEEEHHPPSAPVSGRGGVHNMRTLASFSLQGKTGIVTGGARGLGLVMSQALIISGADVAIVDMNKDEADRQAKSLLETFKAENPHETRYVELPQVVCWAGIDHFSRMPRITTHFCDVSSPTSVKQAFADIMNKQGKVDTLITSAGFTENYDAISYPYDRIQKLWGVNVDGTYLFAVEAAKHFMSREAPGAITFIGSMSGAIVNVPQPQAPYNAAKAAVRHLAASLAVEWAHKNIRVNTISPGYMLTALTKKILDENPELMRQWTSLIPVGKMGRPEDLMGAAVFLSSDASSYMTGAELRVDANLIPPTAPLLKDARFQKDRQELSGREFSPEAFTRARPEALHVLRDLFEMLEYDMLADGRAWICEERLTLADIEAAWIIDWLLSMPGALPKDLFGDHVYPQTFSWWRRFSEEVQAARRAMAKPMRVSGKQAAAQILGSSVRYETTHDATDPLGLQPGEWVTVWPWDSGSNPEHRDTGRLVALGSREVVIEKQVSGRVLRIHACRWGFRIAKCPKTARM
ncbi:MAG: hypothetical protein Q9159_007342 [Coniocarpon cinnabarinum]